MLCRALLIGRNAWFWSYLGTPLPHTLHASPSRRPGLTVRLYDLQGCPSVTGQVVDSLNKLCGRLTHLNLSQCKHIERPALRQVFEHGHLLSLNLSFVDEMCDDVFSDPPNVFTVGEEMHQRAELAAAGGRHPAATGTGTGMAMAGGAQTSHCDRTCPLPDKHAEPFATSTVPAPSTPSYSHSYTRQRCSPLRVLSLAKSSLTDAAIPQMSFLTSLSEVHLQWCSGVTDTGVAALVAACPQLSCIDLKSCAITNRAVEVIAKNVRDLRGLDVSWCAAITDAGIQVMMINDYTLHLLGPHRNLDWGLDRDQGGGNGLTHPPPCLSFSS